MASDDHQSSEIWTRFSLTPEPVFFPLGYILFFLCSGGYLHLLPQIGSQHIFWKAQWADESSFSWRQALFCRAHACLCLLLGGHFTLTLNAPSTSTFPLLGARGPSRVHVQEHTPRSAFSRWEGKEVPQPPWRAWPASATRDGNLQCGRDQSLCLELHLLFCSVIPVTHCRQIRGSSFHL